MRSPPLHDFRMSGNQDLWDAMEIDLTRRQENQDPIDL